MGNSCSGKHSCGKCKNRATYMTRYEMNAREHRNLFGQQLPDRTVNPVGDIVLVGFETDGTTSLLVTSSHYYCDGCWETADIKNPSESSVKLCIKRNGKGFSNEYD